MENQNQEIDALRELLREKVIEKNTAEIFSPSYFPEPTKIQKLQEEEFNLQKRLLQIKEEKGDNARQEATLKQEIKRRRRRWQELQYEKKLSENQLSMTFQDTLKEIKPGPV